MKITTLICIFLFNVGLRSSSPPPPQPIKSPNTIASSSISQGSNNGLLYDYNNRGHFMSLNSSSSSSTRSKDSEEIRSSNSIISSLNSQFRASMPFHLSRSDVEGRSYSTIPIIMPAAAQLNVHLPDSSYNEDEFDDDDYEESSKQRASNNRPKKKKNFSKLAKDLLAKPNSIANAGRALRPASQSVVLSDLPKAARSNTKSAKKTKAKVDLNGYCGYRTDGLWEDPNECESFIICFAGRTFRTKCAYGTSWNHIRKECDFPEKVDCERRASTTTEEPTTPISTEPPLTTTPVLAPKLSAYTVRNNHRVGDTNSNHVMNRSVLNNIRLNILLTLILIPTVIFILTLIGCTLWYWRRKFRLERHRLDFSNSVKLSGAASAAAANRDENKETSSNASITIIENTATVASNDGILQNRATKCDGKRAQLMKKLTCISRLCEFMSHHKQFKPKLIVSCAGGGGGHSTSHNRLSNINNIDLVRGRITSPSSAASSKVVLGCVKAVMSSHDDVIAVQSSQPTVGAAKTTLLDQSITVKYPHKATSTSSAIANQNQPATTPFKQHLSLVDVCNHHASQSHITLSSHFEENNWDYNFATRGLYLSQPWVRGRYTHTMGSESMAATSGVLTLDPTTELSLEFNQPATTQNGAANGGRFIDIYVETGGSDTDGYYA